MNKEKIITDFDIILKSKKSNSIAIKVVLIFSLVVITSVLFFAYKMNAEALKKVVVVDSGGIYLRTLVEDREHRETTFIINTCSILMKKINSFDRFSVTDNQTEAFYYCSKPELIPIFEKYKQEKCYQSVVERGVVYSCELDNVQLISEADEQNLISVEFTGVMKVKDGYSITKYRIISKGKITAVKPKFPSNVTGYFFTAYNQQILAYESDE